MEEAEAEFLRRRGLKDLDAGATKIPNMERMPIGCCLWVLGLLALIVYVIYSVLTKRPA